MLRGSLKVDVRQLVKFQERVDRNGLPSLPDIYTETSADSTSLIEIYQQAPNLIRCTSWRESTRSEDPW